MCELVLEASCLTIYVGRLCLETLVLFFHREAANWQSVTFLPLVKASSLALRVPNKHALRVSNMTFTQSEIFMCTTMCPQAGGRFLEEA